MLEFRHLQTLLAERDRGTRARSIDSIAAALMIAAGMSALATLAAPACSSAENSFAVASGLPCEQVAGWPKLALRHRCIPQAVRLQAAFGDTSKVVWAATRAGFDMLVHRSNDGVSGVIRSTGTWEYDHLRAMEARRPPPATFPKRYADVGANLGYHTMVAASKGYQVDAFEVMPANAAMINMSLCANPQLSRLVHLRNVGFSSSPRTCIFVSADTNKADAIARCDLPSADQFKQAGYQVRGLLPLSTISAVLSKDYYAMKVRAARSGWHA